jgi:hypothetical protein
MRLQKTQEPAARIQEPVKIKVVLLAVHYKMWQRAANLILFTQIKNLAPAWFFIR